jgi:hypothetical protein
MIYRNHVTLEILFQNLQEEYLSEGFDCEGLKFNETLARIVILQEKKIENIAWEIEKLKQNSRGVL